MTDSAIQTAWNFSNLFPGDEDAIASANAVIKEKTDRFAARWRDKSDYLEDSAALRRALDEYEEWARLYGAGGSAGYYFSLRSALDQNNADIKAKNNQIRDFAKSIENELRFFELRISKIPDEQRKKFLKDPQLAPYRHYLDRLFAWSPYLLSEGEEKILSLESAPARECWIKMMSGFLARETRTITLENGETSRASFAEIVSFLDHGKKSVRDGAAEALNDILAKNADVAEAEINAIFHEKKIEDELRGLPRPDAARHIGDDIDTATVDALIESVGARFDIPARFYALKADLLGVPNLAYHERNVEIGPAPLEYTFRESCALVSRVLKALDPEFAEIFGRFLRDGQIDAFPAQGKTKGAFCAHWLVSHPTYILLNHTGRLRDVLTLAHETGHGINNELMKRKQNALSFGTTVATAEVASTFMEDFVLENISQGVNEETRLAMLMSKLNEDVSSVFRQVACYRFEQELHREFREKGYLPKEAIGALFQKHMALYMGERVEQSKGSEYWWVYWSHIRNFFYTYSYASGLLISKFLQRSVRENPEYMRHIKEFLSVGLSASPKEMFANLGIDTAGSSIWENGILEIETLLRKAEALAKKLGKI